MTTTQSLAYGSKSVQNNYTVHIGTGVNVAGKLVLVLLHCGTNGAGGTNDTRIEESDDNVTFTAWTGGSFTQVTTGNDNADYKKAYTGTKTYIRTASKVLVAACEFGTSILTNEAETADDDELIDDIKSAREHVEDITRRALITQTWDYYLDEWPGIDKIKLPFGNLQSVTSVSWKDMEGTETVLTVNTDYIVQTNGEGCGWVFLPYGVSWPSGSLFPSLPIKIRYVCGWTAANLIPSKIKVAIKMICADMYMNREGQSQTAFLYKENPRVNKLLSSSRLWDEF